MLATRHTLIFYIEEQFCFCLGLATALSIPLAIGVDPALFLVVEDVVPRDVFVRVCVCGVNERRSVFRRADTIEHVFGGI